MLNDRHPVDAESIAAFTRDGHVRIDGLATVEELAPYERAISGQVEIARARARPLEERSTYDKAFLQLANLWRRDEAIAEFVLAPRFATVAAALLGVERVRLYHDQALYKEPGGGRTPWHQDALYWPLDGARCITMWMALAPVTADMGPMRFADGSHRVGALSGEHISDESDADFERLLREQGATITGTGAMAVGDASFHTGWTVHAAGPNRTEAMRPAMTVIWFADGETVQEPANDAQRFDMLVWLPGCEPGGLAASEINPLIERPADD